MNSVQPGALTTAKPSAAKTTAVLTTAMATAAATLAAAGAPPGTEDYLQDGNADDLRRARSCWIRFELPLAFRVASALFTQALSGLPFWKTIPKCSPAARREAARGSLQFGTWTAVT